MDDFAPGRRLLTPARVAALLACLALAHVACDDPVGALFGVTAISTEAEGHTHRCSIPLSDIDDPPAGGRTYTSTTERGHAHTVRLSESQLRELQQPGAAVDVVTSMESGEVALHTHVFDFVR